MEVALYNDEVNRELYNVKTGETTNVMLKDCETRVITYGECNIKDVIISVEGMFYLPDNDGDEAETPTREFVDGGDSD